MIDVVAGRAADSPVREAQGAQSTGALCDTALAAAVARDRPDALAETYRRYGASVRGLARRLCGSGPAETVTREVFLGLWHAPGAFDPALGSLGSHLLAATHCRAVDLLRSDTARRAGDASVSSGHAKPHGLEPEVIAGSVGARAWELVAELSEPERQAIFLAYFCGYAYHQVATRLHRPGETVRADIRTGLIRLRGKLPVNPLTAEAAASGPAPIRLRGAGAVSLRPSDRLERGRHKARLTHGELFLRYFELGGMSSALQVEAFCYGALGPSTHDHDVVAHALNERFVELGVDDRIPYSGHGGDAGESRELDDIR